MEILHQGTVRFAEVHFYFRIGLDDTYKTLAYASLFSLPDEAIYQHTHGVLTVCEYQGKQTEDEQNENADNLVVIEIESIIAVVGMAPFEKRGGDHNPSFYLAEKIGLDVYDRDATVAEDADDEE